MAGERTHDDLADELAQAERWPEAADAQRAAIADGSADGDAGREMLAWYLLKAGEAAEAEALFAELLTERPDDPDLALTAGLAQLDAGRPEQAAECLERALALSLAATLDADILREAAQERRRALDLAARDPAPIDEHAAQALERLERQADGDPIAVPWYPRAEYELALQHIEGFAADWRAIAHEDYSRELDRRLHDVVGVHGHTPLIVPVQVQAFLAYAGSAALDPEWAETRARYADAHRDEALAWPPGRNDACWCGADAKYKRHCGA
jgi:tetratricopeptide (TPR) repeat protein